jgi:hypothetical protein
VNLWGKIFDCWNLSYLIFTMGVSNSFPHRTK